MIIMLYFYMNKKTIDMNTSNNQTKRDLSFNEWVMKYNVSSNYVEPTKYFQGNPSSGFRPIQEETFIQRIFRLLGF